MEREEVESEPVTEDQEVEAEDREIEEERPEYEAESSRQKMVLELRLWRF